MPRPAALFRLASPIRTAAICLLFHRARIASRLIKRVNIPIGSFERRANRWTTADLYYGSPISVVEDGTTLGSNIPRSSGGREADSADCAAKAFAASPKYHFIFWHNRDDVDVLHCSNVVYGIVFRPPHLCVSSLLRYLAPKKPKGWGVVSDAEDKNRLRKRLVRLFAREYDKLIDVQVTGTKGRYAF